MPFQLLLFRPRAASGGGFKRTNALKMPCGLKATLSFELTRCMTRFSPPKPDVSPGRPAASRDKGSLLAVPGSTSSDTLHRRDRPLLGWVTLGPRASRPATHRKQGRGGARGLTKQPWPRHLFVLCKGSILKYRLEEPSEHVWDVTIHESGKS